MPEPVRNSVTIAAPVSTVIEVVSDLENTSRWANEAKEARILEKDDQGRPAKVRVVLGAIGFTDTSVYEVAYTDTSVTLTCVEGKLIKESVIGYVAHDEGDGTTRLDMSSTMEVNVPVPKWGLKKAMHSSADKNLASIKADAEAS